MKVLMKPIEMIAWFKKDGLPTPMKFKMMDEENCDIAVKVDKILVREEEKLAGNRMLVYKCQSMMNDVERLYELKYEINTCKWFLYKI